MQLELTKVDHDIARAEDDVGRVVGPDLGLERASEVDLGEHAKADLLERRDLELGALDSGGRCAAPCFFVDFFI